MPHFSTPTIIEQRAFGQLQWLTLAAPDLASAARPGQYLLLRCADAHSADPLLRRALFVAQVDRSRGSVALLYTPDEAGTAWLATRRSGDQLDSLGPLGTPFNLDNRTRNLLLLGTGPGLAALFALAHSAVQRGCAVMLLAAASCNDRLPPPFLLPAEVEYQASTASDEAVFTLLEGDRPSGNSSKVSGSNAPRLPSSTLPLAWADQLCAALPPHLLAPLAAHVRATKLRWAPGFATVALDGALPCGIGVCQCCLIATREGLRTRCKDGPVFDLRDLQV